MSRPPARALPRPTAADLHGLMSVAAGRRPADKVIRHINLVNVHLPRVEKDVALALHRDRIAATGPDLDHLIGPRTEVIEGGGRTAVPGLIDAHTHLDSMFTVREFARLALVSGNTTAVSEAAMIAGAAGSAGVEGFMAEAAGLPLRVLFLAPPLVPPFPHLETSAGLDFPSFRKILRRPEVVGLGETYWRPALDLPSRVTRRFAAARKSGKTLEGHAAGAHGPNLTAYRAGGITSCHESTTAQEALEKLALGITVMVREGYIRRELPAMAPLTRMKDLDTRRLILCTDLASPKMLLKSGVLNELVRRAVKTGFDVLKALQMVTLNPADYFGLRDLGRLDPGALADLVLFDDLDRLNAELVLVGGRVVAEGGRLTVDLPDFTYPPGLHRSFRLERLAPGDFGLRAPSGPVQVRAVAVVNETITREELVRTTSERGRIKADPEKDLQKIAMFDKHSAPPRGSVGLARGWGLRAGALASSLNWDANNVFVVGASDREMARAANRLLELEGGIVVVKGGRVLAEMPLPVGGIISEKTFRELLAEGDAVEKAVWDLGSKLTRPFLTLQTFCFTGLPFLRLTDKGLVDVRKGELVEVVV
ncbi:MAG: adenine deaminase C-terminal domain-containing protein [Thermodesulfobacteriota bacterium]